MCPMTCTLYTYTYDSIARIMTTEFSSLGLRAYEKKSVKWGDYSGFHLTEHLKFRSSLNTKTNKNNIVYNTRYNV